MAWNTKRDGYYTRPSEQGPHTPTLNTPTPKSTHKVTIPGVKFVAHVNGIERAEKLAKQLARTTVGMVGRHKVYAQPVITELPTIAKEISNVA